jgi:hypothetical protein
VIVGSKRHSQLLGLLDGAVVGPEVAASVGPKAAVALGGRAVAVKEAEVPVWRSGRWRPGQWRSRGIGVEESGGGGAAGP